MRACIIIMLNDVHVSGKGSRERERWEGREEFETSGRDLDRERDESIILCTTLNFVGSWK